MNSKDRADNKELMSYETGKHRLAMGLAEPGWLGLFVRQCDKLAADKDS
jgi:hypothetical protein